MLLIDVKVPVVLRVCPDFCPLGEDLGDYSEVPQHVEHQFYLIDRERNDCGLRRGSVQCRNLGPYNARGDRSQRNHTAD